MFALCARASWRARASNRLFSQSHDGMAAAAVAGGAASGFDRLMPASPHLTNRLHKLNIWRPTAIQRLAVPRLLRRSGDAALQSATGSGKTLAYLLPAAAATDVQQHHVQTVVVAPTRELVIQIHRVARTVAEYKNKKGNGLTVRAFTGSASRSVTFRLGPHCLLRRTLFRVVMAQPPLLQG